MVQASRLFVALARRKNEREIFRVVGRQEARFNCSAQGFGVAHPNKTCRGHCGPVFDPSSSFGGAQNGHCCKPTLLLEACWNEQKLSERERLRHLDVKENAISHLSRMAIERWR
jgi:hypothetical protein